MELLDQAPDVLRCSQLAGESSAASNNFLA